MTESYVITVTAKTAGVIVAVLVHPGISDQMQITVLNNIGDDHPGLQPVVTNEQAIVHGAADRAVLNWKSFAAAR